MKPIVVVLLVFLSVLKRRCDISFVQATREFTLFKQSRRLPGPSMSFNVCLAQNVFQFEFKTFVERALVLYQDDNGRFDYIELTLQGGKVYLAFNTNTKKRWFSSRGKYNDFEWHRVTISRNSTTTSIALDDKEYQAFKTLGRYSIFYSNLQIGAFTPKRFESRNEISRQVAWKLYVGDPVKNKKRGYFNACVRDIKYGETGSSLKFIQDIPKLRYRVNEGCSLTYCHKPEPFCKNKGICSIIDGSRDSDKVKCDCRWTGYEGVNCTKGALELTLNGTYKVNCRFKDFISAKSEKYKFLINTTAKNAMILHSKESPKISEKDKISIQIIDSFILVTSNVGKGAIKLRTKKIVSDNKWHLIEYERKAKKDNKIHYILTFDGKVTDGDEITSRAVNYEKMDYHKGIVYLGRNHDAHPPVKLQDLIWRFDDSNGSNLTYNIITALFESFNHSSKPVFTVTPRDVFPMFNRKLIVRPTKRVTVVTQPTAGVECGLREGSSCSTEDPPVTGTPDIGSKAKRGSEDDSSVTWIIVVAVICALILFAIIAFLVHKWNKRFSGDFQVNRKQIGPVGTVVHYKDAGHKEKERQAKI